MEKTARDMGLFRCLLQSSKLLSFGLVQEQQTQNEELVASLELLVAVMAHVSHIHSYLDLVI